jgi:hypothetical protein
MPISGMYSVRELNHQENWLLQYKTYEKICSIKKKVQHKLEYVQIEKNCDTNIIKLRQISYFGGGGLNQNSKCLLKRNWGKSVLLFNILLKNA